MRGTHEENYFSHLLYLVFADQCIVYMELSVCQRGPGDLSPGDSAQFFNQIVLDRAWNAGHGGVYVPVTDKTRPNPFLKDPLRDIEVNGNLKLTKINPAFMTRQISQIAKERNGVQFHITSLNPIRPENRASTREKTAMQAFDQGKKEVGEFITGETNDTFFYVAPLLTEKECLQCHACQ